MNRLRLLIVDPHEVVRRGLRALLEPGDQYELVGEVAGGSAVEDAVERLRPDIVLTDFGSKSWCGLGVITRLKVTAPHLRVITFTERDEEGFVRSAFDAGVAGYVLKQSPPSVLRDALRVVGRGGMFVDPQLSGLVEVGRGQATISTPLSSREREVVGLVALGYTSKEIALQTQVSVKTVETYRYRAVGKLGLRNRADLVRYALYRGWMTDHRNVA